MDIRDSLSCGGRTSFPKGCGAKNIVSIFCVWWHRTPVEVYIGEALSLGGRTSLCRYTDINIKVGLEGLGFRVYIEGVVDRGQRTKYNGVKILYRSFLSVSDILKP